MAGSSMGWESDPLFPAAEVVQDSADRMDSLYRLLMHEWNLVHEESKDSKLLSSIQYHKRDLVTAVETTKWQLEDFERAVDFAALSDETGSRENAISTHRQFINAIREQIVLVDKCLEEISFGDSNRSMQWTNLNEPDAVGLSFFLSGSDFMDHQVHYNSENSIMNRFFNSTGSTGEIIELEPEEIHLQVNDVRHLNINSNSSKDITLWESGLNHLEDPGLESSVFPQEGIRENGCNATDDVVIYNTDAGKSRMKYLFSRNRIIGNLLRHLHYFWFSNKYRFSRNFMKRRKDGELTDDILVDIDECKKNISSAEQSKQARMDLTFGFDICQRLNFRGLRSPMQVCKWLEALPRRFYQSSSLFQHITFHMWSAIVVLVTVAILGLLVLSFI
uniref:Syntaxin-61 n=1 Tax=Anthurium amnicola TaxID=1678845 RepID=A0A1D1XS93_9ARAE